LSPDEARDWYELHRRTEPPRVEVSDQHDSGSADGRAVSKGWSPLTPYDEIDPALRPWLRHPWFLRVLVEAYHGKRVHGARWVREMLGEVCKARIYGRTAEECELFEDRAGFVTELVGLLRERRTTTVYRGADFLTGRMSRAIDERQRPLSAYLQL